MAHYDFIEIGAGPRDVLAASAHDGSTGISVEPVKTWFDLLPVRDGWHNLRAAIGETAGRSEIWSVKPGFFYRFPEWVRGCSSVGRQHPTVKRLLAERGLSPGDVLHSEPVEVLTVADLFDRCDVDSADLFKIDTEGDDPAVIRSLVAACEERGFWPHRIEWERNCLSPAADQLATNSLLTGIGYEVSPGGTYTGMREQTGVAVLGG